MDNETQYEELINRLEQGFNSLFENFTSDELDFISKYIDIKELVMDSLDDIKPSE